MKDKWMNVGFEDDELRPYVEPELNLSDSVRIGLSNLDLCSAPYLSGHVIPHHYPPPLCFLVPFPCQSAGCQLM